MMPLLAQAETGGYFNLFKIVLFLLATVLWAYSVPWVQTDPKVTKTPNAGWFSGVLASGPVCLLLWMLLPMYAVGFVLFLAGYGSVIISYVVARNKRVSPGKRVLTMAHFRRLTSGGGGGKSEKAAAQEFDTKERTRIKDHAGSVPEWPKNKEEVAGYQAVQDLLFDAIFRRATNIRLDFIPQQPVKIIYKVDGIERAREPVDAETAASLLRHLKTISGMKSDEHRRPQDGRFKAAIGTAGLGERAVQISARTSGSTAGQRMELRLVSDDAKLQTTQLGMMPDQFALLEKWSGADKGVLLITGPRDSGITTTLYAILRTHDAFMKNIHTLEAPKTMDLENITQHAYEKDESGTTFGKRFRSVMRMEPDVMMASHTPDAETAMFAADGAKHGKKVYLGMATLDTFSALRKYIEGVGDAGLAGASLLGIINQRLVRVLCQQCRKAYKPDPKLLKKGNLPNDPNRVFYRPPNPNEIETDKQGNQTQCPVCQGTGYVGRVGVFEVLPLDTELRTLISKGTPLPTVKVEARKKGMRYLQEAALHKVYEGLTSVNEVLRVTKESAAQPPKAKG